MSGKRVMLVMLAGGLMATLCAAQLNIDLSTAALDPSTGNYCVMQKVCISNPPEGLTSSGCPMGPPEGCDCDPTNPNDDYCSAGTYCHESCKCLKEGCQCDPTSPTKDDTCGLDEMCLDDCTCSRFKAGCGCNTDGDCGNEERCVNNCTCQKCSSPRNTPIVNPPLTFVIDTTKSVKPDKDSIFNLTMKVVANIMKDNINIPKYTLVTFNDFGPRIEENVAIELETTDVREFGRATANLRFESYNGGRDSKERLTQGLLVALMNALPQSLIVVFTDNGTKNLNLEKEIISLTKEKGCTVYIVLTPEFEGRPTGKSLPLYNRIGELFMINEVGADKFLKTVKDFEENTCV